jgi:molybdopterin-guanine dinucleotide biosynthesis protein A
MGRDKALLPLRGVGLAEAACRLLAAICPAVAVADAGRGLLAGWPSVRDGPGKGPLAGILGAAGAYPGKPLLVLACDLPNVPAALLATLSVSPGDWVLPRWNRGLEPLCALYRRAALTRLAARAGRGLNSLHDAAQEAGLTMRYFEEGEIAAFGDPVEIFRNLNHPEDVAELNR